MIRAFPFVSVAEHSADLLINFALNSAAGLLTVNVSVYECRVRRNGATGSTKTETSLFMLLLLYG